MKISKRSWHYRLVNLFHSPAYNSCDYYKQVATSLLIVAFGIFLLCIPLLLLWSYAKNQGLDIQWWHWPVSFVGFWLCMAIFAGLVILWENRKPGIVSRFIEDRKEKTCKHIDFED